MNFDHIESTHLIVAALVIGAILVLGILRVSFSGAIQVT